MHMTKIQLTFFGLRYVHCASSTRIPYAGYCQIQSHNTVKIAPFNMPGLDNSLGCAILCHAMVDSVYTVFFLQKIGPRLASLLYYR